eukprot:6464970-Heterocapsa_arctica.AAC.1
MLGPPPVAVQAREPRTRQLGGGPACNGSGGRNGHCLPQALAHDRRDLAQRGLRAGLLRGGLLDG